MNEKFTDWAGKRIRGRRRCHIERSFGCIPLEGDEICLSCFKKELEEKAPRRDYAKGAARR